MPSFKALAMVIALVALLPLANPHGTRSPSGLQAPIHAASPAASLPVMAGWGGSRLDEVVRSDASNPFSVVFPDERASNQEMQVRHLAALGLNVFRVSFESACSSWREMGPFSTDSLNRSITIARHYDMWIVVDYHGYDDLMSSSSADCWLTFWAPVVQQFMNSYDRLVWEPINEPTGFGDTNVAWLSLQYQRWINQTRAEGDSHWVVVENLCSYACNFTDWADGYPNVTNPSSRVFISLHSYFFYDICTSGGYGASCAWNATGAGLMAHKYYQAVLDGMARTGWPALNTEGGAVAFSTNSCSFDCAPDTVLSGDSGYSATSFYFLQTLTNLYDSNQPSRINWIWWPMGSWTNTPGAGVLGALASNGWGGLLQFERVTPAGLVGDVNGDCVVDILDAAIVAFSYAKAAGDPGFDVRADVNKDGVVSILDAAIVAFNYGQQC